MRRRRERIQSRRSLPQRHPSAPSRGPLGIVLCVFPERIHPCLSLILGSMRATTTSTIRFTVMMRRANRKRAACTTGKSYVRIAFNSRLATPGQEKTVSVTTAPPTRNPNCNPTRFTTGMRAFLKACFTTTFPSERPFAERAYVILREDIEHSRSDQSHGRRALPNSHTKRREDEMFPCSITRDWKPAQLDAKDNHHHDGKPEQGHRLPHHSKRRGEIVYERMALKC